MFNFLFKIRRRFFMYFDRARVLLKILEYNSLYKDRFEVDSSLTFGKRFEVLFDDSKSSVQIAGGVVLRNSCELRAGNNGKIIIGSNNFFNNYCSVQCFYEIKIGNNCQFGEAIRIYDMNHEFREPGKMISDQGYNGAKISIGNNCWLGSNVTILKGVTIGDNVVIGANCLIYRSIPSNSVVMQQSSLLIKPIV